LFLIGLPKSGTSTLFKFLASHPHINGSNPKETLYFLDKNYPLIANKNYWNCNSGWSKFYKGKDATQYLLEGTTHTIFQKDIPKLLQSKISDIKLIVILREPSERIYSSFQYTKNNLARIDSGVTFARYVEDLIGCKELDYIQHPKSKFVLQNELKNSSYNDLLKNWDSFIQKGNMHIVCFHELFGVNSDHIIKGIFSWLGLDSKKIIFKYENKTKKIKYSKLHKIIRNARLILQGVEIPILLKRNYWKLISKSPSKMEKEDLNALNKLRKYFKVSLIDLETNYNIKLESTFKRKINHAL